MAGGPDQHPAQCAHDGARTALLISSAAGEALYLSMGFEVVEFLAELWVAGTLGHLRRAGHRMNLYRHSNRFTPPSGDRQQAAIDLDGGTVDIGSVV